MVAGQQQQAVALAEERSSSPSRSARSGQASALITRAVALANAGEYAHVREDLMRPPC